MLPCHRKAEAGRLATQPPHATTISLTFLDTFDVLKPTILMDYDALSSSQKEALSQLQALTNGGDVEVAIGVLDSVEWDVQVSIVLRASLNVTLHPSSAP